MLQKRIPTTILVAVASAVAAAAVYTSSEYVESSASTAGAASPAPNQPGPARATTADGSVTMTAKLSHDVISSDLQTAWLRVKLDAAKVEGGERPPLDVALVIDQSGSMGGARKLEQAQSAAKELVARMGAEDRMSIVSFHSYPETQAAMTSVAANEQALRRAIDGLYATGGTNIHAAYHHGLGTITADSRPASRVMFLLSDGLGTYTAQQLGEATARGLSQHDTTITTLGIGDDFNEQTLGAMAVRGGGKFYYVETPEKLREHLSAEWEGLATAAARGVQLQFAPGAGVEIQEVLGYETTSVDGTTQVQLDSLFSERSRQIIVKLGIKPAQVADPLIEVKLAYDDVTSQPALPVSSATELSVRRVERKASAEDVNSDVLSRVLRVQTALTADKADKLMTDRRPDEAKRVLDEQRALNAKFVAEHGATEELDLATKQLSRSVDDLNRPVMEKRQIRIRKKRKARTIEIIAGDRR